MIQKIEPAAAIRLLDAKKAQAVDVREPDEYVYSFTFAPRNQVRIFG